VRASHVARRSTAVSNSGLRWTNAWLADRLQAFVDLNPEFETAVERLATWLARTDDADLD